MDQFGIRLKSVEYFDVQKAAWRDGPDLLTARSGALALSVGGRLVAVGGRGSLEEGPLSSAECLDPRDPKALRWSPLPPMGTPRDRPMGAVAFRLGVHQQEPWESGSRRDTTVLVVCGGLGAGGQVLRSVEIYEPDSGRWREAGGAAMPEGRYGGATASINGLVYLIGGLTEDGFAAPDAALVYDVAHDVWLSDGKVDPLLLAPPPPLSQQGGSSVDDAFVRLGFPGGMGKQLDDVPMVDPRQRQVFTPTQGWGRRGSSNAPSSSSSSRRSGRPGSRGRSGQVAPGAAVSVGLRSPVDHVPFEDRKEDDTYYGLRDGGQMVVLEGNRLALIGDAASPH